VFVYTPVTYGMISDEDEESEVAVEAMIYNQ
jgi:hypothetical protein